MKSDNLLSPFTFFGDLKVCLDDSITPSFKQLAVDFSGWVEDLSDAAEDEYAPCPCTNAHCVGGVDFPLKWGREFDDISVYHFPYFVDVLDEEDESFVGETSRYSTFEKLTSLLI